MNQRENLFAFLITLFFIISFSSCKDNSIGSESATGTISGVVRDSKTGIAIKLVNVTTQPPTESVLTDSSGSFSINAKEGNYVITATKSGYTTNSIAISVINGKETTSNIILSSIDANNRPPTTPILLTPSDGAVDVSKFTKLQWDCSDPDNDTLYYDVYFGNNNPPTSKVAASIKINSYLPLNLKDTTTYYWRVTAQDRFGAQTSSTVFSYKTSLPSTSDTTLLAYYQFNGNTNDVSGRGYNGISSNVSWTTGRIGQAAYFNGNSSIIRVNNVPDVNSEFTVSVWINPDMNDFGNDFQDNIFIVGKWGEGGISNASYTLALQKSTGFAEAWTHTGSQTTSLFGKLKIPSNTWTHIIMTRDFSGILKIYINGSLNAQSTSVMPQASQYPLTIGSSSGGTYFHGLIDNVRIYNRALNLDEIINLYYSGS
ncbi:MAG: carboxypeptidase-like regulatory domain-containing protein [Candidatus Kapabacteria bacterium]|nr:carboxypeptidase-like regulatory domain-containing protein [Candidatus Kapabacteria bacterium]